MRTTTTIIASVLTLLILTPGLAWGQEPDGGEAEKEVQEAQREGTSGAETEAETGEASEGETTGETESESLVDEDGEAQEETWEDLAADSYENFQPDLPTTDSSAGPTVLAIQWMLERTGYGPGVLDGRWGSNTVNALTAFQGANGLEVTGTADRETWDKLAGEARDGEGALRPLTDHQVSAETAEGPFVEIPEDYVEQAELDCLCYESLHEALAEELHTTPEVLEQLNPEVDFAALAAGDTVLGPDVGGTERERGAGGEVASILISKDDFFLHALDADGNIVYHFPTTVGEGYDPSPSGDFKITAVAPDPNFHYQPKLFSDVSNDKPEKMLPPGPNNPVGLVWMSLSKENYGIHGTAAPATIGHSTSHGCVRLTNWDATFLAAKTGAGVPVKFTGGDGDGAEEAEGEEGGEGSEGAEGSESGE